MPYSYDNSNMSGVHIPSVSADASSYYGTYNLNSVDRRNSSESQEIAASNLFQTQSHSQSQYHDQQQQPQVSQYHSQQQQHTSSIVSLGTSAQHVVGVSGTDTMTGPPYQTSAFTTYPHTTYHHPQTPLSAPVGTTYDSTPVTTSNPLSLGDPISVSGADHHVYPGMVSVASATSDTTNAMFPTSPPPPPPTNMQQTMPLQTPSISSQTGCLSSSDMRFECILEASTAAAQKVDEPSLTYLNKGQLYGISILDKTQTNTIYTTTVRIAFHEDSHRKNSSTYWNFWLNQQEVPRSAQAIELDKAGSLGITMTSDRQFDKVSFQWHGLRGAKLMVRFNCLSTDFSRIKGVKGIPLRINMDTYQVTPNDVATSISAITNTSGDMHTGSMSDLAASISQMSSPVAAGGSSNSNCGAVQQRQQQYPQSSMASGSSKGTLIERCYARIKLFRDKGAERKNKDDQKHLDKLWARQKAKLASQNNSASAALKQQKLADFTMSYSQVQEFTVFGKCTLSEDEDDYEKPILFDDLWAAGTANMLGPSNTASSMSTPVAALSSMNINIPGIHLGNLSTPLSPAAAAAAAAATYMRKRSSVDGPDLMLPPNSKRQFSPNSLNNTTTTIGFNNTELVGVDPNYIPNPNKKMAVLAIYAKFQGENIYRAIYLERLDVEDLVSKMKQYLDSKLLNMDVKDLDVLRMTKNGLAVKVDDSMLRQMKDEQDMEVECLVSQDTGVPTICLRF